MPHINCLNQIFTAYVNAVKDATSSWPHKCVIIIANDVDNPPPLQEGLERVPEGAGRVPSLIYKTIKMFIAA